MAFIENLGLSVQVHVEGESRIQYLGVITEGENKGHLDYSTDSVLSKNGMFNVEKVDGGLVHIRSCLTNKYWTRSSADGYWIVAQGVEPVEDETSWMCTLFGMDIDDNKLARFYHVQSGSKVTIPADGTDRKLFLTIDPLSTAYEPRAIDHDQFVILPKFVAFKGSNQLYWKNFRNGNNNELASRFTASDLADPAIVCEINYHNDGNFRLNIPNNNNDKTKYFWHYDFSYEDRIGWQVTELDQDHPEHFDFGAIRIGDATSNKIALRSLANNKICKRHNFSNGENDGLQASADGLLADTHLEVVEPVFNRTVNVYEFDLDNARIYNVQLIFTHDHVWNNPTDETQSGTADGRMTSTKSFSWSNGVSVMLGAKTTFTSGIPFIASAEIEISTEVTYTGEWGHTQEDSEEVGDIFTVVVKPNMRTIARGVATKGLCDVPFSYVQKDYPADGGPPIVTELSNGVFTGANAYGFQAEVRYEELPPELLVPDQAPQVKYYTRPAQKPTPVKPSYGRA